MSEALNEISSALAKLDAKNDDHWTENGLPRLDALGLKGLTRQDLTAAAPLFTRANLELPKVEVKPPEAPKVELAVRSDQDDYDTLVELSEQAEAKLKEARGLLTEVQAEVHALSIQRDTVLARIERVRPKNENMLGIKAVLARGIENRMEKADIANQLRKVGVTAALLAAGSPLDRAMARKRGFGLNRPTAQAPVK